MIEAPAPHPLGKWGTPVELEVRRRIQLSVAAYAYEFESSPVMGDDLFDWFAGRICKHMGTCHPVVDEFFKVHFSPMTGMWIHHHPELDGIRRIYKRNADDMRAYFARPEVLKLTAKDLPK